MYCGEVSHSLTGLRGLVAVRRFCLWENAFVMLKSRVPNHQAPMGTENQQQRKISNGNCQVRVLLGSKVLSAEGLV